jgi:hypothetical protein
MNGEARVTGVKAQHDAEAVAIVEALASKIDQWKRELAERDTFELLLSVSRAQQKLTDLVNRYGR